MRLLLCNCSSHKMTDIVFEQMGKCPKCCSKTVKEVENNSDFELAKRKLTERNISSKKTGSDNKEIYDSWMRFIRNRSR